jgi:hypothetical protein
MVKSRYGKDVATQSIPRLIIKQKETIKRTITKDNIVEGKFVDKVSTIIKSLQIVKGDIEVILKALNQHKLAFPEYCQCFANDTEYLDEEPNVWFASLFPLVLTIRDYIISENTRKSKMSN